MNNFTNYTFKNYIFLIMLCLGLQSAISQCPNIVWQDEFSGTSLDLSKWNYQIGDGCSESICGWGNNELQSYQQDNITVSNGALKITVKQERTKGSQYTSGRINSKEKGDFTYGRFEASIKLPLGDGLWPAFWMLSTDEVYGSWPQSGEIDVMEFVATNREEILGYLHYGELYPNNQSQGKVFKLQNGTFPDAFHQFAIEWEPGEIRWYMDGILYSIKRTEDLSPFNWPFDKNFHFLLNVAVGGNLGGMVNNNMLPATMEVDYVRVYDGFKAYIEGSSIVVHQAKRETYALGNVPNNTNVTWTVPQGSTLVSGQGSNTIVIDFGTISGDVTATFNNGCTSQSLTIPVTVEPPFIKSYVFENFDDESTAILFSTTSVLNEVSNPAPNTLNNSVLSGEYIRNGSELYDLVIYSVNTITDASDYVTKSKKIFMDVYTAAPVGTEVILQLENSEATTSNYPTGRHSRYMATIEETNIWQRLQFTFLDRPDPSASNSSVDTLILLFASNSLTSDTYYYDNLDTYNVDTATTSNLAPTVNITSPSDGSTFEQGSTLSITADASDADGFIAQVEFFVNGSSIGIDSLSPYAIDWQVASGTSTLTAVATDNENATATSSSVSVTGQTPGSPTSVTVFSVATGTASAGKGSNYGTASVTIVDDLGNLIANATVMGTFSGSYNEQNNAVTNSYGVASLQTVSSVKGTVIVDFCIDNVSYSTLTYNSINIFSCSNISTRSLAKIADNKISNDLNSDFKIYPNPAKEVIQFSLKNDISFMVEVYDLNGKCILKKDVDANSNSINISTLPKSIYIIKVYDNYDNIFVKKLIKY